MDEPLSPTAAKALIVQILESGGVLEFSAHAREEMHNDGVSEAEVRAVLRGGIIEPAELEKGTWRYRISVTRADRRKLLSTYVVVAFRSETSTVVVTVWRKRR